MQVELQLLTFIQDGTTDTNATTTLIGHKRVLYEENKTSVFQ